MEKLYTTLDDCKPRLNGRSLNAMRLKQIREKALSQNTYTELQNNPYLEIWDVDYYSTSDEEDNDSGKESDSESDSRSSQDSEVDSDEKNESKTKQAAAADAEKEPESTEKTMEVAKGSGEEDINPLIPPPTEEEKKEEGVPAAKDPTGFQPKSPRAGKGMTRPIKKKEVKVDPVDQLLEKDKTLARRDVQAKLYKIRNKKSLRKRVFVFEEAAEDYEEYKNWYNTDMENIYFAMYARHRTCYRKGD